MLYPDVTLLAAKDAFKMHQATHIGPGNDLGTMPDVVGNPVFTHFYRNGFLCHTEGTAETTAFVDPIERYQFDALDQIKQLLWF